MPLTPVIPAEAGIQNGLSPFWKRAVLLDALDARHSCGSRNPERAIPFLEMSGVS